ncbi:sulfotransferase domain-containing protein [Salinibacter sp.]|jgi:hypothetical protein|uniref:sulfotransferase domain-containing protein n=1 Tax=Salinibacter sp. TaxID=2065818 RepID=UPI0021E95D39|nr:sulfotransferase domain-containing protein [Salinibacter sp.]
MARHVIIVGAAKSGTSTLFQYLGTHKRVNTSAGKEPHYFCDGFYEDHQKEGTDYEDLWTSSRGDICLEATTGYTKYPVITGAPENMVEYGLSPKIIYVAREPISRLKSHIKYMVWRDRSIGADKLRKISVASSMYYSQINRFVDAFGAGAVKLVLLDDLASNPDSCVREIFEFIGIDPVSVEESRKENETRAVTNLELILRDSPLWSLKSLLSDGVKSKLRHLCTLFSESPEAEIIGRIGEERLRTMCEDALRLETLFDVDLMPWRRSIGRSPLLAEIESLDA